MTPGPSPLPAGLVRKKAVDVTAGDVILVHSSFRPVFVAVAFPALDGTVERIEFTMISARYTSVGRETEFSIAVVAHAPEDDVVAWEPSGGSGSFVRRPPTRRKQS